VSAIPPPVWANRLRTSLDTVQARVVALTSGLSAKQMNWRSSPDSWSIGQCLDHLRATNTIYVPPMSDSLPSVAAGPVDEIRPGWFGRFFIRAVIEPTQATRKFKAPAKATPGSAVDAIITERFLKSNELAYALIDKAGPHDVNRVRFVNPFVPLIRFTVGTGLEILTRHQHRHLLQAQRVRAHPGFPQE
jgi:hypothetical protein